jgi:serine/threonine protein kinase
MAARGLQPGDVVAGFRLEEELPLAATAAFWRVSRAADDLPLLMKIPRLEQGANPINIVGFEAEQMILPKLSGPHVPRFIASGSLDSPYIVMELIVGESLRAQLAKLPLPAEAVATLGAKIASALHDIHRQEVIHLDLKPSNIILRTTGEVALIDFGFSRHLRLPDILAEEFPGPIGTGPYRAGETARQSDRPAQRILPSVIPISSSPANGLSAIRAACGMAPSSLSRAGTPARSARRLPRLAAGAHSALA